MASTVFSAQFENLGELVKNLIFPVGVDTFPTELSGRLRHVFSPAGAGHLTYLGDAEIGDNVNIGAGTITCNYDGANKHKTIIGDDVFVGSDTQLVAPVTVGNGVTIAAGTTVTRNIADNELVLSRVPQVHKQGWQRPVKKK